MTELGAVKRIKVRRMHTRKLFFEKVLADWKDSTDDRNFRSVLFRAHLNLKNYPLEVSSIAELKSIKGIGELIATKLYAAWNCICSNYLSIPTIKQIKELNKGECLQFINSSPMCSSAPLPPSCPASTNMTADTARPVTNDVPPSKVINSPKKARPHGQRQRAAKVLILDDVPSGAGAQPSDVPDTGLSRTRKRAARKASTAPDASKKDSQKRTPKYLVMEQAVSAGFVVTAPRGSFPCVASLADRPSSSGTEHVTNSVISSAASVLQPSVKYNAYSDKPEELVLGGDNEGTLSYSASNFHTSKVILLVDNREHHGGRKGRSICDYLQKKGIVFEMRSLSVGDYVWVIRMKDGTEVMLDYIVERKTVDDMVQSIRSSRYKEQKQRLSNSGLRYVVYLVEGNSHCEKGVDQALSCTSLINGFMVKITGTMDETAQFLHAITKRLIQRARTENMKAVSFERFQQSSRKTQRRTVKDVFTRMLTVCPRMTVEKATIVANRFPTLFELTRFYKSIPREQRPMALAEAIPGIPKPLSRQLAVFFDGI